MKKELTIEHRCAYAPHGVQVLAKGGLPPYADEIRTPPPCGLLMTDGKMILRHLSDLTREITHNGETFVPIERMGRDLIVDRTDLLNIKGMFDMGIGHEVEWQIIKMIHSWHFDTFGLIESGLAIDINMLTK